MPLPCRPGPPGRCGGGVVTCAILPHRAGYLPSIWASTEVLMFRGPLTTTEIDGPLQPGPFGGFMTRMMAATRRPPPSLAASGTAIIRPVPSGSPARAKRYARRRRRRIATKVHDLTGVQWAALQAAWGGCAYCGATDKALQKDCVLPISRGGRYEVCNVVPCCRSCNTSKCNVEVTSWMRRKKLDESRFLLRHAEVNAYLAANEALT